VPNPESQPYDYDEVTRLRLRLAHTETQRDAFKEALNTEVLKVMRVSVIQATIDADEEIARLKSENLLVREESDRHYGLWVQSQAEVADLKSTADRLKAEVERLEKGIQPEGSNDAVGRAVELLLEKEKEIANLKAEVERLTELNATLSLRYDATKSMLDGCAKEIEEMEAEVERLRKAGDKLVFALEAMDIIMDMDSEHPEVAEWKAAKEGKQS